MQQQGTTEKEGFRAWMMWHIIRIQVCFIYFFVLYLLTYMYIVVHLCMPWRRIKAKETGPNDVTRRSSSGMFYFIFFVLLLSPLSACHR